MKEQMKKRMGIIMWLVGMIGVLSILPFVYSLPITLRVMRTISPVDSSF